MTLKSLPLAAKPCLWPSRDLRQSMMLWLPWTVFVPTCSPILLSWLFHVLEIPPAPLIVSSTVSAFATSAGGITESTSFAHAAAVPAAYGCHFLFLCESA